MKYPKLEKAHDYLGHFKGCLREGHNTNAWEGINSSPLPKPKVPSPKKYPPPGGIRG